MLVQIAPPMVLNMYTGVLFQVNHLNFTKLHFKLLKTTSMDFTAANLWAWSVVQNAAIISGNISLKTKVDTKNHHSWKEIPVPKHPFLGPGLFLSGECHQCAQFFSEGCRDMAFIRLFLDFFPHMQRIVSVSNYAKLLKWCLAFRNSKVVTLNIIIPVNYDDISKKTP